MTAIKVLNKEFARELTDPILCIENLSVKIKTPEKKILPVLTDINLDVPKSKILGVVGESGSGKTMLAKTILGLNRSQNYEISGKVIFNGINLLEISAKELRKIRGSQISMIFQDPLSALNPVMKVGKQITEAILTHLDVSKSEATEQTFELLRSVGIPDPEKRFHWYPHQLSGGQRQRILIALALACGPVMLLADEPTTGLDATLRRQIIELIAREQIQRDMSVILISHDLATISQISDYVAVMYGGKIVELAPTKTIFTHSKMPYTSALLEAIPKINSDTKLKSIKGSPPNLEDLNRGCPFAPRCDVAQPVCFKINPPIFFDEDPSHKYSCFFPIGSKEYDIASEINEYKLANEISFESPLSENSQLNKQDNELVKTSEQLNNPDIEPTSDEVFSDE
jgi:peptide/nickel transport system ATP-binding protein